MLADVISALVRALSFIALFQAAGIAIFIAIFGSQLELASAAVRRLGFVSAIAGIVLVSVHYLLEAARMAGALAGVLDLSLQQLVFDSPMSVAWGLRTAGLTLIAAAANSNARTWTHVGVVGAALAVAGFLLVGHTSVHAHRLWLAMLLSLHLAIVAFWFGALAPLHLVSRKERAVVASQLISNFSRIAGWWVPCILLAGALLTVALVDRWAVFAESYGLILLGKVAAFAALMGLAALNKYRYAPALATAAGGAAFRRAVVTEYLLICAVLAATAVMTTFFSPEH